MTVKNCKIIVRVQQPSLDLVRYIDKNLATINKRGFRISIQKLADSDFDDDTVTKLSRKGIMRLPAMIDSEGTAYVGNKQIIDVFEGANAVAARDAKISAPPNAEFGSDPLLSNYWQKEMFQYDRNSGKYEPRKDDEEHEEDRASRAIQRQMAMYESRGPPKQRRAANPVDLDDEPRRGTRARDDDDDNIDPDGDDGLDYGGHGGGGGGRGGGRDGGGQRERADARDMPGMPSDGLPGDMLDQKMMSAWLQNNGANVD